MYNIWDIRNQILNRAAFREEDALAFKLNYVFPPKFLENRIYIISLCKFLILHFCIQPYVVCPVKYKLVNRELAIYVAC